VRVAISGSTGLVGSALIAKCEAEGHECRRIVRRDSPNKTDIYWDPASGSMHSENLSEVDAVVHLAGDNIAEGRWNAAKKNRIRFSRVDGTRLLCESLAQMDAPPDTLIAASAIGYYGSRGDEICNEENIPGSDFLADVCVEWEAATRAASEAGIRVVNLRIGVVLSTKGGALTKMLLPFKLCAGGRVGNGKQYWSWISLHDVVGAILHCIYNEQLSGPVNAVAPNPVTNLEFTKMLGKVLGRPTIIPMPAFMARLMLGEMADALLLSSTRVTPQKLQSEGYDFTHKQLEDALRDLL